MGNLLKLEWLKIRKYRAFMVLTALGVVSLFGINYLVYNVAQAIETEGAAANGVNLIGMIVGRPFDFPQVWQTVSCLGGLLLCVSGLLVILLMSNEYSFRTARQNVIDGVSRAQFIDTKIALILVTAAGLTVIVFIVGLIFGLTGTEPFSLRATKYLAYFFVQAMSHMSVALVFVTLLKRSGVSIGIYLMYVFIIENVAGVLMNKQIAEGVGHFLPIRSADKLIPMPGKVGEMASSVDIAPGYLLVAAVLWIAACLVFCKYRFQRKDL